MEFIIYSLLFLVLIAFICVIGYIVYDNYTYKNNLTTDLNTNFVDINQNFHSTSNILGRLDNKHTSNYNVLDGKIGNTSNLLNQRIDNTSNLFNQRIDNTSNLLDRRIYDSSNLLDGSIKDVNRKSTTNFDTFGYNMNKYFAFNNTNTANSFNESTNKKIFEYRTVASDINSRLDLITETTATAGLKINSDSNNPFKVCNKSGMSCFNMYGNDNDLYIYGTNPNNMNRNIYIGSDDKTNAPIRIENSVVKVNNVDVSALRGEVTTLRADVNTLIADVKTLRTPAETRKAAEAAVVTAKAKVDAALLAVTAALNAKTAADSKVTTTAGTAGASAAIAEQEAAVKEVTKTNDAKKAADDELAKAQAAVAALPIA